MTHFSIAIDGPAGAGKSTIAKELAKKLQCIYIDTGAMYRCVGLYCIQNTIDYTQESLVEKILPLLSIELLYKDGIQMIRLNGENVSTAIRNDEVAAAASKVATYTKVREALVGMQRELARKQSVVMDGRDIGTVVLKDATLKIFLTADAKKRAKRRYLEYTQKGVEASLEAILADILKRDEQDTNRVVSPLKQAEDAIAIDSTSLSIIEIVERMSELLHLRQE